MDFIQCPFFIRTHSSNLEPVAHELDNLLMLFGFFNQLIFHVAEANFISSTKWVASTEGFPSHLLNCFPSGVSNNVKGKIPLGLYFSASNSFCFFISAGILFL